MNKPNRATGFAALGRGVLKGAVLVCMTLTTVWAQAQNAIQSITGGIQGGVEVIRINTTQPLAALPTGFTIQAPARIALDFPGVANAIGRNAVDINEGNLRSANVVQAGDRTRVVINLKQSAAYEARIEGKTLLVVLERAQPVTAATVPPSAFAENRNRDVAALRDIDFRRGVGNAGRVVVELANNQVGVDIRQQGQNLVVEFLKTSLPEGLRRRLDVSDFGTPIQSVTTSQAGDRVRMVVTPTGNWEHSAYQSDNQFVLEVREQKIDSSKLTQGPGYNGEKLSLNFQNIEVRSLLQVIADFTNFNIVTSDSVTGAVTLRLKDVPWDQALDIILQAKGLGMRKSGNVLWIAPKDEIAAREKQELESKVSIESLETLRTQGFQMNYAKAADIAAQLTAGGSSTSSAGGSTGARILSDRGSVISEPRTNQLFVTDIASRLEQVQELIRKLDIPIRQVMIEARIVEADDTFGKSLGVRLGGGVRGFGVGSANGSPIQGNFGSNYGAASSLAGPTLTSAPFVNLPANPSNAQAASFALSLFNPSASRFLSLEISALESDGKGRIVSSPRVVTADQVKALIEQGTEFPYQTATSSGATAIAFRKANLKLEVTPQITPEGNIILDLDINKDSRGESTPDGIAINTKHVQTQVLVENGGTVVIGGIFEQTERDEVNKVPLLGDLPAVGNLFKSRNRVANKSELLIFFTPRVLGRAAIN
ncbi:MAG: type IV pilus secretin PilQ [Hydrogenophaga sp.]|uniref:type IV pilus secretin PilQ n=1 Tax=Hydrogenophaga sp. TaxID=1904254 RepID=UPI0025BE8665|nr:type IV pilus secretin PilQ [Hydrogenophaga sp.]MBU7573032.1 type IV pilus secretin PilQ [Hydrogenophaga sp.]